MGDRLDFMPWLFAARASEEQREQPPTSVIGAGALGTDRGVHRPGPAP
jgi:hypothetical protein